MKRFMFLIVIIVGMFACNSSPKDGDTDKADSANKETDVSSGTTAADEKGLELIGASDCTTCHTLDKKNIGPAYIDVANKYEASEAVIDTLVSKIIYGGQGVWGTVAMTPHPTLSKDTAREMVKYILSLKK